VDGAVRILAYAVVGLFLIWAGVEIVEAITR
jgi:hypothetical protein